MSFLDFYQEGKEILSKRLSCNKCNCSDFSLTLHAFSADLVCVKCGKEHRISISNFINKRR